MKRKFFGFLVGVGWRRLLFVNMVFWKLELVISYVFVYMKLDDLFKYFSKIRKFCFFRKLVF